jgi:hypothetical protein
MAEAALAGAGGDPPAARGTLQHIQKLLSSHEGPNIPRPITIAPCNTSAMYPFKKERKTSMSYQTINPFTEKLVRTFPEQTDEQLKTIIHQAHDTFSNDWSKRSVADRKKVLKDAVKLFRERREELA